jgi:hypothetical protein
MSLVIIFFKIQGKMFHHKVLQTSIGPQLLHQLIHCREYQHINKNEGDCCNKMELKEEQGENTLHPLYFWPKKVHILYSEKPKI